MKYGLLGGGGGIRTHGGSHLTRFRGVLLWPLGHATVGQGTGPVATVLPRRSRPAVPNTRPRTRLPRPRDGGSAAGRGRRPRATRQRPPSGPTRRTPAV